MKKFFFIFLFLNLFAFGQVVNPDNRFSQSERGNDKTGKKLDNESKPEVIKSGPGNPGEPVPINDYLGILGLVGLGLIMLVSIKSKNINQKKMGNFL